MSHIIFRDKAPVVWFVSNCNSYNKREIYAKVLSQYIGLHIYGRNGINWIAIFYFFYLLNIFHLFSISLANVYLFSCGTKECGETRTILNYRSIEKEDCFDLVNRNYKFIITMENTNCKDYVTEKTYNELKQVKKT